MTFDPRLTPARPDLAAAQLRGRIEAGRYADGVAQEVIVGTTPVRKEPSHEAPLLTEALRGERVTIYDSDENGWAWGQLASDGYVGYLPAAALLAPGPEPTHKVAALRTFEFPGPSIKLPPADALPLGAQVAVASTDDTFAMTASGGHVPARHLAPLAAAETDFVAVAERFAGVPYLWGGKTSLGIDCSGLVQVALTACGIVCPRDSDMQERALGKSVSLAGLQHGDLIFWKGHVAIARGRNSMIHANAFHMAVTVEPVAEGLARIGAAGSQVTSVRRLG
ncbi:MAG: NlpC/P60 family protein [Alphaproteobacteria bacterium]|nr:NlpC/P60 family protein [Alphaproteobacteria bacterium]